MLHSIAVDTHTHTVLSGHAWSTLRENAAMAARKGLAGICLTEHAHAMPGSGPFFMIAAQRMLPKTMEGVRVYMGVEANIIDLEGGLDLSDKNLLACEFCIASLHDLCVKPGTPAENTVALVAALRHPAIDVLGHIDDPRVPCDFEKVILAAGEMGKLIEINTNSVLSRKKERVAEVAALCARHDVMVTVASDAHVDERIGAVGPALEVLAGVGFPEALVVNRSADAFEDYLDARQARIAKAGIGG